jgi:hypothetical protein
VEEAEVIVLWIMLWILAGIMGLVLVLLLVPFGASAQGSVQDLDLEGEFRIWWGFGLVQLRGGAGEVPHLRLAGVHVKTLGGDDDEDEADDEKKAKKKKRKKPRPGARWLLEHRRTLLRAAYRLLGSFRLEGRISGSFGTGDPADTAALFGVLQMVNVRTALLRLDVTPRYVDEGWDLEGQVRFGAWPMRTVVAALGLLFNRDVRRAMKAARV